ncbi:MAG: radical SAM-associated putative lipoprotein [Alistipes sp.]|nr:radical SAM-associated putative lipoprotein [Alistipes sp.]
MKRLLYFILSLLGFGAASCEHFIPACEYGTPHVSFSLKARVIDQEGNPIQGIEVRTKDGYPFEDRTGVADYQGNIDARGSVWPGSQYEVVFLDVDGELNGGEFEPLELDISGKVVQWENASGNWYDGGYRADLGDVTMTLKQTEDNSAEEI